MLAVSKRAASCAAMITLLAWAIVPLAAQAASSSANFVSPVDAVNNGVADSASANFNAGASVGEAFSTVTSSSANFTDKPGFQPAVHLVAVAPSITSVNNVTFTVNSAGTFTVTTTGGPVPTLSVTGALPAGITFTPATGVLAGTPASGTAGVYPLTFTAANGNLPDAQQNFTLTVVKVAQTIAFGPQGPQTYVPGGVFTINPLATATSGLAVTYSSLTTGVCTVSGINVSIISAGTCTIAADQPGNGIYVAALQVTQNVNIARRNQAINFGAIGSKAFSASPLPISATSTSGLAVAFSSATTGVCTVAGSTVTFVSLGTCTINADQPGDANTNPAPQVQQSFTITQGTQTITFVSPAAQPLGTSFTVSATASSGLAVTFTSQTPATCSTSGTNGATISTLALGTCTLRASQAGNANYQAASPVIQSFTITQASSTMVLASSPNLAAYGAPITLSATVTGSSPTGTVTFSVATSSGPVVLCNAVSLVSGQATCAVPGTFNKSSPVNYTAAYGGDANNTPITVAAQVIVSLGRLSLSATATPLAPQAGQPLTLRAALSGTALTGTMAFYENGVTLPGCAAVALALLPGGTDTAIATCTVSAPATGNHTYVVTYRHPNDPGFEQVNVPVTVAANGPLDYSDMWWAGQSENGWGVSITQHGSVQFNVFYVYDAAGKPVFYVMPGGTWNAAQTSITGALYQPTSSPFSAYDSTQFKPNGAGSGPVGTATFNYTSNSTATVTYTINGVSGSKNIQRELFSGDDGLPRLQVNDLWWGGVEQNGWGINIAQQGRMLFPVWYTYDANGRDTWFAVPGGTWRGNSFTGDIYTTTSSAWLGTPYDASALAAVKVGMMTLTFSDQNLATMTYTVNGVTQTKVIVRQPY